jgi:signal transduction histidine kinase/CheY-like chemotaxis protein
MNKTNDKNQLDIDVGDDLDDELGLDLGNDLDDGLDDISEEQEDNADFQRLNLENTQLNRQLKVLRKEHQKLVDDNYRQFLLHQEREKEYARNLESEILKRTAELRVTNQELKEANRLTNEFLANMSHELRTPMNAILGFCELMRETKLTKEQEEYNQTVSRAGQSLLVLINDVLDLAKIESGKMELQQASFSFDVLLKGVSDMFLAPAKDKNITLKTSKDPQIPKALLGDINRLRQILVNITGNAIKFTPENGHVLIECETIKRVRDLVEVKFSVRDTGIGIPPEQQKSIFEKFVQVDGSNTRQYGGTGLGLAICNQFVSLMGGRMTLASIPGHGSTFSFSLKLKMPAEPEVAEKKEEIRVERKSVTEDSAEKKSVLLVEDNLTNQRLAQLMISRQGYEVVIAADGLIALDKLKEKEFGLVLMDVQMPNMDGLEATRKIREIEKSPDLLKAYNGIHGADRPVKIVGLTAHARKENEEECYHAGMDDFMTKPIVKKKLVKLINDYLL